MESEIAIKLTSSKTLTIPSQGRNLQSQQDDLLHHDQQQGVMVHHRRDCQTSTDTEDHIHARRRRIPLSVLQALVAGHSFIRYHNQQDPMIVNQLRASMAAPTCLPALWLTCLPALWLTPLSKLSLPSKHNCPMHKTPPITLSAVRSY